MNGNGIPNAMFPQNNPPFVQQQYSNHNSGQQYFNQQNYNNNFNPSMNPQYNTMQNGQNPQMMYQNPSPMNNLPFPMQVLPPTMQGMAPPMQGMAPPMQGMAPPMQGMAPPMQGMVPPMQGMVPPMQGMAPPMQGMGGQIPVGFGLGNKISSLLPYMIQGNKWVVAELELTKEYANKKQEFFQNKISQIQITNSIQFNLSPNKTIWVQKDLFFDRQLLGVLEKSEVDLTPIFNITGRTEDCENAIFYSHFGYIQLNQEKEMSYFLMACILLNIEKPFSRLQKFYDQNQQEVQNLQNAFILSNSEEIIDLMVFQDWCLNKSQQHQIIFNPSQPNSIQNSYNLYLNLLKSKNPQFYMNPQNGFSEKIVGFSPEFFLSNFIGMIANDIFYGFQYNISVQQVEIFYKFLECYYRSAQFDNPQQQIDQVMDFYYNQFISAKLNELERIECLKYLPKDSDSIIDLLKRQHLQIQEIQKREKAYIKMLIAQRAQNIALDSYGKSFKDTFKIFSGEDLNNEIEQQLQSEIYTLKQGQQ